MTAITHRFLHLRFLRPRHLYYPHHFSPYIPPPQSQPKPSFSSYSSHVTATIQGEHPPQKPLRRPLSSPQTPPPPKSNNLEEIRRNLAEYRNRSAAPPPSGQNVALEELRETNLVRKHDWSATSSDSPALSFDAIKESLRYLLPDGLERNQNYSFSRFRENLNASVRPPALVRGSGGLLEKENDRGEDDRSASIRMYDYSELGSKLKTLRPEKKKGKWFTLVELNERLAKLREIEEKESQTRVGGVSWRDLRNTMIVNSDASKRKLKNKTMQRLDVLGQLGGTPSYLLKDPKDHLVEKYFHPDNMSSAEKLKMELKKVRDEFKMSVSDCGSARVQVALLTTKIRHLSTVLHKKDKHSRRGLQAMVQRRKKLLKYLRRTDWDSYCFVLSRLSLRDNPDIKT